MKKKISFIFTLMLIVLTATAAAQKISWSDPDFDFSKINRVTFIIRSVPENLENNPLLLKMVETSLASEAKRLEISNRVLLPYAQEKEALLSLPTASLQLDSAVLDQLSQQLFPYLPDAIVLVDVKKMEWVTKNFPAYSYTKVKNEKTTISGADGEKYEISVPRERTVHVPARREKDPTAILSMNMYDLKSGKFIWAYEETKDSSGNSPFSARTPEDNMKSILYKSIKNMPLKKK